MDYQWYYVIGKEPRVGPISNTEILDLVKTGKVGPDHYVWRKGLDNWQKVKDVKDLVITNANEETDIPPTISAVSFDWKTVNFDEKIFTVKVGLDRDEGPQEYGPYSLKVVKRLYNEHRINGKTLIFTPGMEEWIFVADIPDFKHVFDKNPPILSDEDRRLHLRRPFTARLFFNDSSRLYEGVCRDISVGGMQVMIAGYPGVAGEKITLNVHPDNSAHRFVAEAQIVRVLNGALGFSVRFTNLSEEAKIAISKYIESES